MTRSHILERETATAVLEALEVAYAEGAVDGAGGGVGSDEIADRIGLTQSTTGTYLRAFIDAGEIEQVQGISPDGKPRPSYVPADPPHAGGGSEGYSDERFTRSRGETA